MSPVPLPADPRASRPWPSSRSNPPGRCAAAARATGRAYALILAHLATAARCRIPRPPGRPGGAPRSPTNPAVDSLAGRRPRRPLHAQGPGAPEQQGGDLQARNNALGMNPHPPAEGPQHRGCLGHEVPPRETRTTRPSTTQNKIAGLLRRFSLRQDAHSIASRGPHLACPGVPKPTATHTHSIAPHAHVETIVPTSAPHPSHTIYPNTQSPASSPQQHHLTHQHGIPPHSPLSYPPP